MASSRSIAAIAAFALVSSTCAWYNELPTCLNEFQPFVPVGCFDNGLPGEKEALSMKTDLPVTGMTTEICVAECKGNGFRYAGLAWYGSCYCGQTVDRAIVDSSQCSLPCDGNKTEACGGDTQINVYQDPTFLPVNETTVDEYVGLGCYTDESSYGRALFYQQDLDIESVDTETCLKSCLTGGFPFAGTEYGQECYCGVVMGNETSQADASECAMTCKGNSNQTCGGPNRLTLYVAKDLLSLQPCGYEPPESSTSSTASSTASSSSSSSVSGTSNITASTSTTLTSTTSTITTSASITSTTTKVVSSTTSSAPLCTSTAITPPSCEFKCGKWCSSPLPDWSDSAGCLTAWSSCALQVTSCFKNAGWPDAMDCFNFVEWCSDIKGYCGSSCKGKMCGNKSECLKKSPPTNGQPGTTSTSVYPCTTIATTTTAASTTSSKPTPSKPTSSCPVPTPTGICQQPQNPRYGYDVGTPVGGIQLPVLTCNNLEAQYNAGNIFKLYTESDSTNCGSYPGSRCPEACADACKAQYDDCLGVYAEGCKVDGSSGGKSYGNGYGSRKIRRSSNSDVNDLEIRNNNRFGESYDSATARCKQQYSDCLDANKGTKGDGKCAKYGEGW
ncbi:putative WSC domain-containing protein [Seiridium cardinale]|uniref:WSC domain-containing protein n=1 Tax=Seiridium cardinale TaxID=138064 RepID=A0ABR2XZF3_9PEZI